MELLVGPVFHKMAPPTGETTALMVVDWPSQIVTSLKVIVGIGATETAIEAVSMQP